MLELRRSWRRSDRLRAPRDGVNFEQACRILKCWEDAASQQKRLPPEGPLLRFLVFTFTINADSYRVGLLDEPGVRHECSDGEHLRTCFIDEPGTWHDCLRRIHYQASDRLIQIANGDFENVEGEEAACWEIMAGVLSQVRLAERMELTYG